jgi:hypothetical protein
MARGVTYRGASVTADWPERIAAAQALTHYSSDGRPYARIPFGSEDPRWGERPCRDCAVIRGELHVPNCEYEHCPVCKRGSLQSCGCPIEELGLGEREPSGPGGGFLTSEGVLVLLLSLMFFAGTVAWVIFGVAT